MGSRWLILLLCMLHLETTCQTIEDLLARKPLSDAMVGISVRSMKSGTEIYAHNSNKNFIPASSLKVFPTLLAVKKVGTDHKYQTTVTYKGEIAKGVLNGDLYINASGDPTLGSSERHNGISELNDEIVGTLQAIGITCINGHLLVNIEDKYKQPIGTTWQWDDLTNYYAAGDWGLNLNDNTYLVTYDVSGPLGSRAKVVDVKPDNPSLEFLSEVTIGKRGSGDQSYIYGDPYGQKRIAKGSLAGSNGTYTIKGAIPNPPQFFQQSLSRALSDSGIYIKNEEIKSSSVEHELMVIESAPLSSIASKCLEVSQNLYAESLANLVTGVDDKSSVKQQLQLMNVSNADQVTILDGSGLSARNRISPSTFTDFLYRIDSPGKNNKFISKLLPKVGKEGTVKSLLQGQEINAWVKSGYMTGVLSYTGVMKNAKSKWVSFSIISNGHSSSYSQVKKELENIIKTIWRM